MSSHPADVESFSLWLCEETKMYWQREVEVDSLVWWPVWPNLVNFRHFCNSLKAFGKFLLVLFSIWQNIEPCLAIFYIIGQINIVTISQVLKNNLGRSGHTDINFVRPTDRKLRSNFWHHILKSSWNVSISRKLFSRRASERMPQKVFFYFWMATTTLTWNWSICSRC